MRKHLLVFVLILGSVGLFAGCKSTNKVTTLAVPTNLTIENNFISFDEVKNASYYLVNYDGNTFTLKPTNSGEVVYDGSKIFSEIKTYEIKVKAIGSKNYADSAYSSVVTYSTYKGLDAPTNLSINEKTLNWSKVENATSYTVQIKFPDEKIKCYPFYSTNFDFSPILNAVGKYSFSVKAGGIDENNEFSYSLVYTHTKQHSQPQGVSLIYNEQTEKLYLHFLADDCYGYNIKINGKEYFIESAFIENYLIESQFSNYYIIDLTKFLADKSVYEVADNYTVSVQAVAGTGDNYISSAISKEYNLSISKLIASPVANIQSGESEATLSWQPVENASSYTIYKNSQFYARVDKNQTQISFLKENIANDYFTIQANGVNNYISSPLSNIVSLNSSISAGALSVNFDNETSILSWSNANAESYFVEIVSNYGYKTFKFDSNTKSLNFAENALDYDSYIVKVYAIASDNKISMVRKAEINYTKKLETVNNAQVGSSNSMYTVSFDKVENAFAYQVKIVNTSGETDIEYPIEKLFSSNYINLTDFVLTNGQFDVYVKTKAYPNANISDSDFVKVGELKHLLKLDSPIIQVEELAGRYILKFAEIENAYSYTIKINHAPIYTINEYKASGYDLTSYLTEAQTYYISVIANANPEDTHITNSNETTVSLDRYIQLASINDAKVLEQDGKYYLTFTSQTNAATYDIEIKNQTSGEEEKFNISTTPYDITEYLANKGKYVINVRALPAKDSGYLYLASADSGNPCVYDKTEANLTEITNLELNKKDNKFIASWDAVKYSDGEAEKEVDYYYVQLSYTSNKGVSTLLVQESVTSNSLDITKYITKEGAYQLSAKAVAEGWISRGTQQTEAYNHTMTSADDFRRNKVFMNGEYYSHYIESFDQLKNLVWNYYLYNDSSETVDNAIKFMLKLDEDSAIATASEGEDSVLTVNSSTLVQKMYQDFKGDSEAVAYGDNLAVLTEILIPNSDTSTATILKRYSEIMAYSNLKLQTYINEEELTYYELSFENLLKNDKLESLSEDNSDNVEAYKFFNQKQTPLSTNDRRADNYVFAIDSLEKVEVFTSEQLYMVVQYDKSPNFVESNTTAETIYNNARAILREIINDEMTDYQKVVAIYDWLIENVHYRTIFDDVVTDFSENWSALTTENKLLGEYKYNYLEGIFIVEEGKTREASSNGLAKAFVLMCKIEGIDAIKVNGTNDGDAHFWNKVCIDVDTNDSSTNKLWYSVDIASSYVLNSSLRIQYLKDGKLVSEYYQLPSHSYFLVTDEQIKANGLIEISAIKSVTSVTKFDYWSNTMYMSPTKNKLMFIKDNSGDSDIADEGKWTTAQAFVVDILKYMYNQVNGKNNVFMVIDVINDASAVSMQSCITEAGLTSANIRIAYESYDNYLYILMTPKK